jgi:hypothetical protein
MSKRIGWWAILPAIGVAGVAAAFSTRGEPTSLPDAVSVAPEPSPPAPGTNPHAGVDLPPGHPPIGGSAKLPAMPPASDEPAAITWKMPAAWSEAKSPSSMRLATYRVPHAPGDDADAEVSVSRAGGSTSANIERWVGQFDDAGKDVTKERLVNGLKVTTVEVTGTYAGGAMTPTGGGGRHPKYALLGAVVETQGTSYFFKLTGPAATVHAAHAAFDAMIDGIAAP